MGKILVPIVGMEGIPQRENVDVLGEVDGVFTFFVDGCREFTKFTPWLPMEYGVGWSINKDILVLYIVWLNS